MPVDIFETLLSKKIKYTTRNETDIRYVNLTGDEMVGDLKMNGKKIINLAEPSSSTDALTKNYVYLKLTIPGDVNLNSNKIFFDANKECSTYKNGDMLGLELPGFFVIRGSGNNDYILFIDKYQINCYNKRLKDVKDPSDLKDAANKTHVDLILEKAKEYINLKMAPLRNPYAPGAERYFDCLFIKQTYKPTFWISAYYNSGLQIINESELTRVNELNKITGSPYISNGTFSYDSNLKAFVLLLQIILI